MTPERWQQIETLLHAALARPESERDAFVRSRCADDTGLAREVRSLLDIAAASSGFLEAPAAGGVRALLDDDAENTPDDDPGELVNARLGPYVIERVIASGGMGTVYAARRDDDVYHKTVAVKVVRTVPQDLDPGWQAERLARFTIERQVLAELDHPCIARMLDGGTTRDGRPFLVMEYVEGVPIDLYCDRAGLSIKGRVRLFIRVCEAAAEAHQRLILHRDIKPANILVRADGTPKLLDFGLAKPLDPLHGGHARAQTQDGRFMGTLAYAAPEQIADGGTHQDTRSDIYALGLVLYRLLSGEHAYSASGTMTEVLRRITEQTPSPPSRVNHAVSTDLDVVTLKALAKDPGRRYQSVGEFIADLERALAGDAVLARADSRWYLLSKTVRRYRGPIATAAALGLLVASFGVVMALQAVALAKRSDQLAGALRESNIARGRTLTATGSVSEAERVLWRERLAPGGDPGDEALWALWELYSQYPCLRTLELPAFTGTILRPTPDRSRLIVRGRGTGDDEAGVLVLDARTAGVISSIHARPHTEEALSLSNNGRGILVGTEDGRLHVHDIDTGELTASFTVCESPVLVVQPGPGETVVCTAGSSITIVDLDNPSEKSRIDTAGLNVRHALLLPDRRTVLAACGDGHIRSFNAVDGAVGRVDLEPRRWSKFIAASDDGRYVAADTNGTDIALIDLEEDSIRFLTGARGWINSIRFGRIDGRTALVAASFDKSAYLWEVEGGTLLRTFPGHESLITDADFGPDGRTITTVCNAVVREWEIKPGLCSARMPTPAPIFDVRFLPGEKKLVTTDSDERFAVRVWELGAPSPLRVLTGHTGPVANVAFDPRSGAIYSASYDGTLRVWDPDGESRVLARREGARSGLNALTISPDGTTIAIGTADGSVVLVSPGGEIRRSIRLGDDLERVPSLDFSPDGAWLAATKVAARGPQEISLFSMRGRPDVAFLAHSQTIRVIRFSPTAPILATAGDDLSIRLWSMGEGEIGMPIRTLRGHESDIFDIAFSPDGSRIVSAGRRGVIKIWSAETGACLLTLRPHEDMVFALDFSADGRTLVSAGRDGGVVLTDLTYYDSHIKGNQRAQEAWLTHGTSQRP